MTRAVVLVWFGGTLVVLANRAALQWRSIGGRVIDQLPYNLSVLGLFVAATAWAMHWLRRLDRPEADMEFHREYYDTWDETGLNVKLLVTFTCAAFIAAVFAIVLLAPLYLLAIVSVLVVTIGVVVLVSSVVGRHTVSRGEQLKAERPDHDAETFASAFDGDGIPRQITDTVYQYFQNLMNDDAFPVLATDGIADIYCIGDEDHFEMAFALVRACTGRKPTDDEWQAMGDLVTVGDVIHFVARAARTAVSTTAIR